MGEAWQTPATLGGQGNALGSRRPPAEIGDGRRADQSPIQPLRLGQGPAELGPAHGVAVGQVPEAGLAVDDQVEHGVAQVGRVGGRDHEVAGGAQAPAGGQLAADLGSEVVGIVG